MLTAITFATEKYLCGYAFDDNSPDQHFQVHLTKNGVPIGNTAADLPHSLCWSPSGKHGFILNCESQVDDFQCAININGQEVLSQSVSVTQLGPAIQGNLDQSDGGIVRGWCLDVLRPAAPLVVQIYGDHHFLGETVANGFRQDLVGNLSGSGAHGFEFATDTATGGVLWARTLSEPSIVLKPQQMSFIDRMRWRTGATRRRQATRAITPDQRNRQGRLETWQDGFLSGWSTIENSNSSDILTIIADASHELYAPSVAEKQGPIGRFRVEIPDFLQDGNAHELEIRDCQGRHLHGSPYQVFLPVHQQPVGHLDMPRQRLIKGWAIDLARPDERVTIEIDFDGKAKRTVKANQLREDLIPLLGDNANCGFSVETPDFFPGGKNIHIKALITGSNFALPASRPQFLLPERKQLKVSSADMQPSEPFIRISNDFDPSPGMQYFEKISSCMQKLQKNGPLVSVVMPTWNRAKIIGPAIESVVGQTYTNWELIIVDDASTDNTQAVVKKFLADDRIRYVKIEKGGVSAARNRGIAESNGKIISYLDSDNEWRSFYLSVMVAALHESGADVGYCASRLIKDGEIRFRAAPFDWDELFTGNYIDLNVFVHKRQIYEKLEGFDESLKRMVDWDLILRYTQDHAVEYVPIVAVDYDDSSERTDRITVSEASGYEYVVRSKFMVDWESVARRIRVSNLVSIIIPVFNQPDLVDQCVRSIFENTDGLYEIILVDNGSDLETADRLGALALRFSTCRVVTNFKNLNFALGCNIGAAESLGEFFVFLNSDTLVTAGWLQPLVNTLIDPAVGLAQPKLLYPDGTIQCIGARFNRYSDLPYHIFRGQPGLEARFSKRSKVSAITAACVIARSVDFAKVRGFDPLFVNGGEDSDLCMKYQHQLGLDCFVEPASVVYHLESKSPGRGKMIDYNRALFCSRWAQHIIADDEAALRQAGLVTFGYDSDRMNQQIAVMTPRTIPYSHFSKPGFQLLIVKPCGIGNMVMALPTLVAIKESFPLMHLVVACYEAEREIALPFCDETIVLSKDDETGAANPAALDAYLKNRKFDAAIYPPFTNLGRPSDQMRNSIPLHIRHPKVDFETRHEAEHNLDMARMIGAFPKTSDLPNLKSFSAPTIELDNDYVVVHAGASASRHMQKKLWPQSHWAKLIECVFLADPNKSLVLVGGPGERDSAAAIIASLPVGLGKRITDVTGKLTVMETVTVIGNAQLAYTNDSGLMHVAASTKTPVVAIFGPTLAAKNHPWTSENLYRILRGDVPCTPCYVASAERLNMCNDQICLSHVSAAQVFAAGKEISM